MCFPHVIGGVHLHSARAHVRAPVLYFENRWTYCVEIWWVVSMGRRFMFFIEVARFSTEVDDDGGGQGASIYYR